MRWRKLSRDLTLKFHFFLDQCLPPAIRDSRRLMYPAFRLFFGKKAQLFLDFKESALHLSETELASAYQSAQTVAPDRETDLSSACLDAVLENLRGRTVLDVGAGRGFLAGKVSATRQVTALDIVVDPQLSAKFSQVCFVIGNIQKLPFRDAAFDTVVCAHTLEHVQQIFTTVSELKRVARRRLIVVVPKQRPYRYTFDLHIHFFPYPTSLLSILKPNHGRASCREIGGDLFYLEDLPSAEGTAEEKERVYEPVRSGTSTRK